MTKNKTQALQINKEFIDSNNSLLVPKSLHEGLELAKVIAHSDLAPKDYKGKPENVLIAVQMGLEVGLAPMQAIQNIAVINGRPCVWGDALLAIVQASGKLEWIKEWNKGDTSYCMTKRKEYPQAYTTQFSDVDAKAAGLLNKPGPWSNYKMRMRQMRARAFNLRDQFADIIKGLNSAKEVGDYEELPKKKTYSKTDLAVPNKTEPIEVEVVEDFSCDTEEASSTIENLECISESQRKRLFTLSNEAKLPQEEFITYLKSQYRVDSSRNILKQDYDQICDWIQSQAKLGYEPGEGDS